MSASEHSMTRESKLNAYIELGKLRLSSLAVFAVLSGLCLASRELPDLLITLSTMLATILAAVGGSALNMYIERDTDPLMDRTGGRPLPTGRLSSREVLVFGLVCVALGLTLLAVMTNLVAAGVCALICVTYVLIYTPMKRRSTLNTLVGAVPGGLPPVVGYAAATGRVDAQALVLFLIVFFWQIPHFLAIAWQYREDYRRAGLVMLPTVDPEGIATGRQMIIYAVGLVIVSMLPHYPPFEMFSSFYLLVAVLLGVLFLASTCVAAIKRKPVAMRQCFLVSIVYLPLLFTAMVADNYMMHA